MLARHPYGKLMSDAEIAKRSGLSIMEVTLLSSSLKWELPIESMEAFMKACRCDLENRTHCQRIFNYLKNDPKLLHLRNDSGWERRWKPAIALLNASKNL